MQASGSDANYAKLKAENAEVFGIAASTRFAQKAFAEFAKVQYPLLSAGTDIPAIHKILRAYGVFDEARLVAKRSYVIIDKEGVIRYHDVRPTNTAKDVLTADQLLAAVKKVNEAK